MRKGWRFRFIVHHSDFNLEPHAIRQLVSKAVSAEDEIIDELIRLAKDMREATRHSEDLGFIEAEI